MSDLSVNINVNSHGQWENSINLNGSYEQIKEQVNKFYEMCKVAMDKVIEKEIARQEGASARHTH
jgi:hypothetical protein